MPVYKIRGPDGKIYRYKVNAENPDKEDVLSSFKQQYAIRSALKAFEAPKEEAGFFGSFKEAVTSLGLTDEAAAFAANPTAENREAFLKAAESKYKSVGGFGKGENWEAFKELLGSSLGSLVAPIGAAVVGGGLPGFAAASGAQYSIANLQRQAEAQQAAAEAGEPIPEVSLGKAAAAAAAQTGLDVVPGALILKGLRSFPLAQRLLAEDKVSNKAAQVLIDAFKNKNLSLKGNIAKGVGLGVAFEVPQEIAQQALERWQAGLSLTDDEAKEEFKQAAIGAAVLGGGFGAIGGVGTYRGMQADKAAEAARRAQEQQDIESSLLGAGPIEGGIPAQLYEEDEARKQAELEESMFGAGPIEGGIPADMLEDEADREARLEREAIQAYEREQEARLPQPERRQYSARTLQEAAEAEALAPREEDEEALYIPPERDEEERVIPTPSRTPEEEAQLTEDMLADAREYDAERAATEGVMEGLGAPIEGGIPAEMLAPTPREIALEVIKTTPTIKAVAEATGLNQPKAAALVRQFVDEGILERKGNKFVLAAPPSAAEPEATDVPSAPTVDTETDGRSDRGSPELFTLESPTGELGTVPTRPAGLDTTGDVTERVDDREGTVPPSLETEGVLEGLGAPIEGGIPAEYFAERERVKDLRTRAINFIRETGRGNAPDLQKALDISLGEAKALRKSLLGSGAVVQKTNVKAAKTAGRSYFVVEGDYRPSDKFVPRGAAVSEAREEPVAETGFEELGLEGTSAETGLPPEMLDTYLRLEEARQKAAGRLRGEGVESETERAQREADKAAELTADIKRKLPPTLSPDIGQGEYGLQYYDAEKGLTFRAYPTVGERNEARAKLANERNDKGQLKGNKDFKTFSRMAEVAKFELDYIKRQALPAMSKAQLERAVRGIRAGMSKIKSQLGLFTEEEAPTPQKAAPARVTPRELIDYASRVISLARDSGKLKKYSKRIQRVLEAVQRRDADLRAEYKKLAGIETSLTKAEAELGEATQADLEEISDIDVEETEDGEVRVKERDDTYEPLDFRKTKYQRFKKKKSQVKGMRLDAVRDLVNKITNGWKNPPNFIIVQSYLDLPAEFDPETHADSMGLAYGNDVYLIADNIRHLSDLKAVVFHESLGHYGLEQLFGERLLQVMLDIYRTNSRIRADADAWLEENPDAYPESEYTQDERRALAAEEIFAEMSEAGPSADPKVRAAFNRVAALVRKFIRALGKMVGKELAYNNREIADIVAQAHNKVITGNTRLIPRYNNIRYMKSTYNKVLTDALRYVQNNAPAATQTILTNNINALDKLPEPMRDFKLSTFSLHHMMQLYERYAPSIRRLNLLVERMAKDATDMLVDHQKKTFDYRKTLRDNPNFIDAFNNVANFINISQAPVLEEQLNANGEFVRFVPNVAAQQLRNVPMGSAAYNALTPEEKVLHQAVNQFYALPVDMQRAVADIYTDYRKYSDQAFKVKLEQFLTRLPPTMVAAIKKKYQDNRLKFYLPLRREGTYKLVYQNPDTTKVSKLLVSEAERNLEKEKAIANGATILDDKTVIGDKSYESSNSAPTGLLKELGDNIESALRAANASQTTIDETKRVIFDTFVDYMPATSGNDLRQEINSRVTWVMNGYTFTGRLGAIEDVIGVYEKAVPRMIYQINNLKYTMPLEKVREKISNQLAKYNADKDTDPRFAGLPNLDPDYVKNIKADLDKRIKFAKNPIYSNYVYALSKANYIYSIALNISSALINTTIIPMMAWPSLAAKYGMADATKAVGQAMAMFFRNSYRNPTTGRLQFNINPTFGNGATGEFVRLHRMLEARSVTGTSAEQELQQAQNITVPGYEGLSAKVNLAMSYVFRSSERFNREVTAIATYMLARNIDANGQRLNPNRGQASVGKATEEAIRLNYDVNGATLPETNSRLYQNDIGRIVLTFRTHALNMILNLAFTFNQAIEKINANQPNATQRKLLRDIARRKLLYIFGSTYMLTGIKGLPLFGAAEVLASLIMGDDDEPYDLEQEVLDSVGTLGLNGPVNELLNIDIASRTGFYGLLWRDDPKRLAEVGSVVYVLERIAGPTYGLVEAARRGFNDLAEGNLQRAAEALTPAPIRNLAKGFRFATEGALTRDGLPIVEDVNAYNSMMQILGFAPADLAVAQAQRGATYQVSEKLKNRRVALLTNLYAARKAGNAEGMEKALDDIRSFNESNPSYRITGDTISKSYSERERRAREAIMGVYQPRSLRIATSEYVADLDEEDGLF